MNKATISTSSRSVTKTILILIIIIILLFIGFFVWPGIIKNGSDEIDTSGWQTYKNTKLGFELKYPEEYIDLWGANEDNDPFAFRFKNGIATIQIGYTCNNECIKNPNNEKNIFHYKFTENGEYFCPKFTIFNNKNIYGASLFYGDMTTEEFYKNHQFEIELFKKIINSIEFK